MFEEQLFTDSDLEDRVRLAEFELADDYTFKRLTDGEAKSFGEKYLLTADRKQKLNVSKALRDRFIAVSRPKTRAGIYRGLTALLDVRQMTWRQAIAALVLILIFVIVFLARKEPEIAKRILRDHFNQIHHTTTPTPQEMHHAAGSAAPAHSDESPVKPVHESPVVIALTSTNAIDQGPVIVLPSGENAMARFQLSIKADQEGVYRADLLTSAGEKIFNADSLKAYGSGPSSISFDVPVRALKSGQYEIRLTRTDNQAKRQVAQYYFRIQ
ncbi:MAG TPA: hypothetical protein VFU37_00275 [Pyrinomonadaceae bacterium]|nr:hypothetical protein [Pyrinomonadaceae bacterium]